MLRIKSLLSLAVASILATSPVMAFNLNEAVMVEAQLRAAARFCTTEDFAKRFTIQSKEQVAFSLTGEDIIQAAKVEELIQEVDSMLNVADLQNIDCDNAYLGLHELYDNRKRALTEGKEITKELEKIQR